MFDIVTIGSATRDEFWKGIKFLVSRGNCFITGEGICLPLGAKIRVPEVYFTTGGSATNTAVTFQRMGLKTAAIFRVGNDVAGEIIIQEQKEEGIDIRFVQRGKELPSAHSVVLLSPKRERTILSYKGSDECLSSTEIPFKKLKTKWLYLGSLGKEKNILKNIIQYAYAHSIRLAINPGREELIWLQQHPSYLRYFDVFICNQEEAAYFTNIPYSKEKAIFKKMDDLVKGIVVMTRGDKGVSVSDGHYLWRAEVYRQNKVQDMTGAGDAFGSGFISVLALSNLSEEKVIPEAIRVGSANAASVITHLGAKAGILFRQNLKRFPWKHLKVKKIQL